MYSNYQISPNLKIPNVVVTSCLFSPQAEDVKALLSDAMLHCSKSAVTNKPVQPKQEHGASPLSTANSRLLASNLPGSGDGASTERPVMELPPGKCWKHG